MNLPVKRVENRTEKHTENRTGKHTEIAQRNRRRGHRQKPETNFKHLQIYSVSINVHLLLTVSGFHSALQSRPSKHNCFDKDTHRYTYGYIEWTSTEI